jgi:AcrR family transcriptional regulator
VSNAWLAEVERQLDEVVGPIDGDDPKHARRRRILDVAGELLASRGYKKTSMDEVARAVGVAKGTLYLYYPTKVDLVLAVISREKRAYLQQLRPMFDENLPARERLRCWLEGILLGASRMPLIGRLMSGDQEMSALLADMPPALMEDATRRRYEWIGSLVEEIVGPHTWTEMELHDRVDALCSLAFLSPALGRPELAQVLSARRCAALLVDLLLDGLEHKKERRER